MELIYTNIETLRDLTNARGDAWAFVANTIYRAAGEGMIEFDEEEEEHTHSFVLLVAADGGEFADSVFDSWRLGSAPEYHISRIQQRKRCSRRQAIARALSAAADVIEAARSDRARVFAEQGTLLPSHD